MNDRRRECDGIGFETTDLGSGDETPGSASWAGPTFDAAAILAGRYRIVRFLARGGMGEVYEAEDTTLRMRVAIKCMSPEVAADARSIERLKREVLLARKVTHPNVCRLHDMGVHAGAGANGTIAFLTMDLLDGETLAHHIARHGRFDEAQALPLLKQMTGALDAAHEAGVIHRDFKTRNVMLVRDGDRRRAVVMDFGIATGTEGDERSALDSGEGRFAGTPAYMAPEQIHGDAIGPWTDVYALGTVMFEMMTGSLPFRGNTPLQAIAMRLTQPPPAPRTVAPSLARSWNDAILRCLALEPGDRFARAGDVAAAIERAAEPRPLPARSRRALVAAGAAALVAVGVAAAKVGPWGHRAPDAASRAIDDPSRRRSLAVLPLKNLAGRADDAWLSTALAEMLTTELSVGGQLRVAATDRVDGARVELGVHDETALGAPVLARLRENLGADYVVTGAYALAGDSSVRLDATLADARTGATIAKVGANGSTRELFDAVAQIGRGLRDELGTRAATTEQATEARASMSADPVAAKAYAEGIAKERAYDYDGARAALERAVAADPRFALAHGALATVWAHIGSDAKYLEEAKTAFDASRGLPHDDQLLLEAKYYAASKEWERAVEASKALYASSPDSIEHGESYARALVAAGRAADALPIVAALHALPPPDGADPRIDCLEASVQAKLSNFAPRLAAARRCVDRAHAIGATRLEAGALVDMGETLSQTGKPDEAMAAFERARALDEALGDRPGLANVLHREAAHLGSAGDPSRAIPLLEQGVAIGRAVGDRYELAGTINSLAIARFTLGDAARARAGWEEARGIYEAIGDREGVAHLIGNIGVAFEYDGELVRAREAYLESRDRLREIKMREGEYQGAWNAGEVSVAAGDVIAATKLAAEAAAVVVDLREVADAQGGMKGLDAMIAREAGDAAKARRAAEEGIAILDAGRVATLAAETRTTLARALLDLGRTADAVTTARAAADALRAQKEPSSQAEALATLATALVAAKKVDDARAAIADADALGAPKVAARLAVDLARAAVLAAGGDAAGATRTLADVRARAEAKGFAGYALEARVSLARLGPPAERAAAMAGVAREARARGLLRIAGDAR